MLGGTFVPLAASIASILFVAFGQRHYQFRGSLLTSDCAGALVGWGLALFYIVTVWASYFATSARP
jgi:hypothetical protein